MTESEYRKVLDKAEKFDIVRIRWRDSSRVGLGWTGLDEYERSIDDARQDLEESSGYFVRANDAFVLIVQSIREFSNGNGTHATDGIMIPHEAVRTIEILAKWAKLDRSPTRTEAPQVGA